MRFLEINAEDDRGRAVRLHRDLLWASDFRWVRPRDEVRAAVRAARRYAGMGVVWVLCLLTGVLSIAILRSSNGVVSPSTRLWTSIGTLVVGGVASMWFFRDRLRSLSKQLVAVFLARGLCPCCGHSLAGLPAADDGCITCPECGAAWTERRVGRDEATSARGRV